MALRSRTRPTPSSPAPPDPQLVKAFEADWATKQRDIENSPIMAFLQVHEIAGTPNEHTICGAGGVKVTIGDLRAYVRLTT